MEPPTTDPDRASDAFLRHVQHDLRSSLNAVISWGELVKAGQLPADDLRRAGDIIIRHARHLSQRLDLALDLWRLDGGHLSLSTRVSSIGAAVRLAVDEARPLFESRRVACGLEVRGDGSASVDVPRLVQALVALLANAAANTPADHSVEVVVDGDAGHVVVRVVGAGLMPDDRAFGRTPADPPATGPTRPFDFGLSLAQALVHLHGGQLAAVAEEGARVAFVVRLPRADAGDRPQR